MKARNRMEAGKENKEKECGSEQAGDKTADLSLFHRVLEWDVAWTKRLAVCATANSDYGAWRPLMRFLEYSAHGVPWLIGNIVAILSTHHITLHEKLLNLFYALLLDLLVVTVIKALVRRPRPAHNVRGDMMTVSVDLFSFPSGHSTRAMMLAYFFASHFCGSTLSVMAVVVWGVCVSVSRVVLGRHHVVDVVCGVVIGLVQYKVFAVYLWLDAETCEGLIRPIQEELHF